jgi:co-chaperonin GroES (HSP10)
MSNIEIRPTADKIYVVLDPVEEKKVGSLIVPRLHSETVRLATIRAIGPDVDPERVRVGGRVVVTYMCGVVLDFFALGNNVVDTHRIVSEAEILCYVTGE